LCQEQIFLYCQPKLQNGEVISWTPGDIKDCNEMKEFFLNVHIVMSRIVIHINVQFKGINRASFILLKSINPKRLNTMKLIVVALALLATVSSKAFKRGHYGDDKCTLNCNTQHDSLIEQCNQLQTQTQIDDCVYKRENQRTDCLNNCP
jgi:hypothetical protein